MCVSVWTHDRILSLSVLLGGALFRSVTSFKVCLYEILTGSKISVTVFSAKFDKNEANTSTVISHGSTYFYFLEKTPKIRKILLVYISCKNCPWEAFSNGQTFKCFHAVVCFVAACSSGILHNASGVYRRFEGT
jgi:hypothetical protein